MPCYTCSNRGRCRNCSCAKRGKKCSNCHPHRNGNCCNQLNADQPTSNTTTDQIDRTDSLTANSTNDQENRIDSLIEEETNPDLDLPSFTLSLNSNGAIPKTALHLRRISKQHIKKSFTGDTTPFPYHQGKREMNSLINYHVYLEHMGNSPLWNR